METNDKTNNGMNDENTRKAAQDAKTFLILLARQPNCPRAAYDVLINAAGILDDLFDLNPVPVGKQA